MISFLIPFRDVDGTRTRTKDWIVARWKAHYPAAEFIIASDDGADPFCKSMAVNNAFKLSHGDIIVILDSDTWITTSAFSAAVEAIEKRTAAWIVPASVSLRLTREASERLFALGPMAETVVAPGDVEEKSYVVGFCHVLPREAFIAVGGMDERFRGWGGEDGAFVRAVDAVYGGHVKIKSTLISLWHDRPRDNSGRRVWIGQNTRLTNSSLWRRYHSTNGNRNQMLAVLKEAYGPLSRYSDVSTRRRKLVGTVTFICKLYPALMVRLGNLKFKFVGGKLTVSADLAPMIQQFADDRPGYEIAAIQVSAPKTVAQLAEKPIEKPVATPVEKEGPDSDESGDEITSMSIGELRQACKAMNLPFDGKKVQLRERLQSAVTA